MNKLLAAVFVFVSSACEPQTVAFSADIHGPNSITVDNLLVLEGVAESGITRWIIPRAYADHALRTQTHIALIPSRVGTITIIFVNAQGRDITFTRHQVEVVEDPQAEFVIHEPKRLAMPRRTAALDTTASSRTLTMYSMPPEMGVCEPCIKWKANEHSKLAGWLFVEETTGDGIKSFPSFQIMAGNHSMFVEGYTTAHQLTELAKELEAIDD